MCVKKIKLPLGYSPSKERAIMIVAKSCNAQSTADTALLYKTVNAIHSQELKYSTSLYVADYPIRTEEFLPRDAMHKHSLCRHAVSTCLYVCLSRS